MAATYTEFYCDSGNVGSVASNANGGSDPSGTGPSFTSSTGSWDGTSVYSSAAVTALNVLAGQFVNIGGTYIARVVSVIAGTSFTCSTTAKAGATPGSGVTTANVGGVWLGPNGASSFPFSLATLPSATDLAADPVRVNLKNGTNYAIATPGITTATAGPITVQGYTTSAGDGGRAIIDGGTSGASYSLLSPSVVEWTFRDLILQNNGATGSVAGVTITGLRTVFERCTINSIRGSGVNVSAVAQFIECEAYGCNQNNGASAAGFGNNAAGASFIRCTSHHNAGTASSGFVFTAAAVMIDCIAAANGLHGFYLSVVANHTLSGCLAYANGVSATGHGAHCNSATAEYVFDNCHWIKNSGAGVNNAQATSQIRMINNGDYSNTSGRIGNTGSGTLGVILDTGGVTYASDPCTDGANGDFSLVLNTAKNAGRGVFFLDASKYSKSTTSFPDIGPVQHLAAGAPYFPSVVYCNPDAGFYQ